jgi:hypothetical protein
MSTIGKAPLTCYGLVGDPPMTDWVIANSSLFMHPVLGHDDIVYRLKGRVERILRLFSILTERRWRGWSDIWNKRCLILAIFIPKEHASVGMRCYMRIQGSRCCHKESKRRRRPTDEKLFGSNIPQDGCNRGGGDTSTFVETRISSADGIYVHPDQLYSTL